MAISASRRKVIFLLLVWINCSRAGDLTPEIIKLPALIVHGESARAHTQGLEIVGAKFYVTARREDARPKRALLLRTQPEGSNWDVWDITPAEADELDHPGGMQSDGRRLWIPISLSKPKSHSIIRVFSLSDIVSGQPLKSSFEFPVNDHIGAVAVSAERDLVLGANWDTETVYLWDTQGHLKQTLTGSELGKRGLGIGVTSRVAVQDWKLIGDHLYASGLCRATISGSRSRWVLFTDFLKPEFQQKAVTLPLQQGTELAREAMAVSDNFVYFIPEDLGATNRLFRIPLASQLK